MEEQLATPISELLILILYLGSITFLLGTLVQIYIIYRNKQSKVKGIIIVLLTRLLTIISSYFIWSIWNNSDIMFAFLYLPGLISEIIFSPLLLLIFGNKINLKRVN